MLSRRPLLARPALLTRRVRRRRWTEALAAGACGGVWALASPVLAAPPAGGGAGGSAGGSIGGGGSGASGDASGSSGRPKKKKSGYELPDFVYGGNAIGPMLPMQFGFVGYMPRVRIALQYDRQLYKGHWIYIGAAALLDNGNRDTFGAGSFDDSISGRGGRGTVAGFDIYGGYVYKIYAKKAPWIVPVVRGGVGLGAWWYPRIRGTPEQPRTSTFSMSLRGGGGVRFFLLRDLGIGIDLNLALGFANHGELTADGAEKASRRPTNFLLGMEVLPLILEYRF